MKAFTAWCIMDIISIPGYVLPTSASSLMEMRLALERIKVIYSETHLVYININIIFGVLKYFSTIYKLQNN